MQISLFSLPILLFGLSVPLLLYQVNKRNWKKKIWLGPQGRFRPWWLFGSKKFWCQKNLVSITPLLFLALLCFVTISNFTSACPVFSLLVFGIFKHARPYYFHHVLLVLGKFPACTFKVWYLQIWNHSLLWLHNWQIAISHRGLIL